MNRIKIFVLANTNFFLNAGLRAWCLGVQVCAVAVNFSSHHHVQTGAGVHPASYLTDTRVSFPGSKAAGTWSWPLTSI